MDKLGRLERVDLREIWETEAQHFTPWLAREENLSVLTATWLDHRQMLTVLW